MIEQLTQLALVAWLPGAALFRVPLGERDRRAGLPAEERLFWQVIISVALSLSIVLALGALGRYRFEYLLWAHAWITAVPVVVWRQHLRFGRAAPPPRLPSAIPLILVVLCASRFLPLRWRRTGRRT